MRTLEALRQDWIEQETSDPPRTRPLSIPESMQHFIDLATTFSPLLHETEVHFRPEREAYLATLQERLKIFAQWQEDHHAESPAEHRKTPKNTR